MVICPCCQKTFGSQIELSLHISHDHRGYVPIVKAKPAVTVEPVAVVEEEHESGPEYALATSKEGLGELCPVLKDHFGNIIDGFHRKGENANWREETCDWIDTPEKLEAARLAVNFARRDMAPEEIKERVTYLVSKAKMSTEQIAKLTGISERTVLKYTPQELKDPAKVAARLGIKENSDEGLHHTVTTPESIPASTGDFTPYVRTFEEATAEVACTPLTASTPCTQPEPEEALSEGCPICPICSASMDLTEYKEIKQKAAAKFGKSIQTLLFPEAS
jgi:hypothetical protein